jgi:transglutaminase-like putative cysteine protease
MRLIPPDDLPLRQPADGVIQVLRLTPRNHDGQYVVRWRIDLSVDCRTRISTRTRSATSCMCSPPMGPFSELRVRWKARSRRSDTDGAWCAAAVERFPPSLYLRETALTRQPTAIATFAAAAATQTGAIAEHPAPDLLARVHGEIVFDTDPTHPATTAAEAFALKRGVCQDLTHVFIACGPQPRHSGALRRRPFPPWRRRGFAGGGPCLGGGLRADLGWIAFDPTNGICATDAHVRVAVGLDYLGAAPVRGTRTAAQARR